jgi:hypothetical protein
MSSNLVIVAIPDENDPVWEVSSEKIPHMTLLFLGDAEKVSRVDQIVLFVEHAANTSLKRFYLPVDHRGELGADQADVLFFKKSRYDFKAVHDFRSLLLRDPNIKTAYDSSTQFEAPDAVGLPGQPWIPHLTLGYPTAPAKPIPTDHISKFYDVNFNKIAVWMGDFEGPEFLLKDYWEDFDEMTFPTDVAMSDLEHFGVKGMHWGQRKDTTVTVNGQTKQVSAKKADKLDKEWNKNAASAETWVKIHNASADHFNAHIESLNAKHSHDMSKEDWDKPDSWSPETKKYMTEVHNLSKEGLDKAVNQLAPSPTGKHKIGIVHGSQYGEWGLVLDEVKHATNNEVTWVKPKRNERGQIVSAEFKMNPMVHTEDLGAEFIEHFGVKGMRWGVRKAAAGAKATSTFVKDVNFEARTARGPEGQSSKATRMVVSAAHKPFKNEDLPAVKTRHGDYAKLINRAKKPLSKEAKAYRKDARETYIKRLETTANSMKNASGTRQYTIRERGVDLPAEGGALPKSKYFWEVSARDVKHAAGNVDVRLELIMADGYITDLKPVELETPMIHGVDLGEEFVLEHFGIKGMRWGVRKERAVTAETHVDTGVFKRQTKIRTTGGEAHPAHVDAVRAAVQKQKLKKSGTDALSTQELRDLANRLQVENQVQMLTSSKGKRFVNKQLEEETKNQISRGTKKGIKKAAPHVIKKASKAAATGAVVVAL